MEYFPQLVEPWVTPVGKPTQDFDDFLTVCRACCFDDLTARRPTLAEGVPYRLGDLHSRNSLAHGHCHSDFDSSLTLGYSIRLDRMSKKRRPSGCFSQSRALHRGFFVIDEHFQIGEVADEVGLSLRTIRYYEEIGLVKPSGRTEGGFRLYTDSDVERLRLVKALKPVGMSLETMADLLGTADLVADSADGSRSDARERLADVVEIAVDRCDELEARLEEARRVLKQLSALTEERR